MESQLERIARVLKKLHLESQHILVRNDQADETAFRNLMEAAQAAVQKGDKILSWPAPAAEGKK